MAQKQQPRMGRYRAIMTDTDREYISGEGDATDNQRMQSVSRVRSRINKELPRDIEVLEEHRPDLIQDLRDVVCVDANADGGVSEGVDPEAARRALDELERALVDGDPDAVEGTIEKVRGALEEADTDE